MYKLRSTKALQHCVLKLCDGDESNNDDNDYDDDGHQDVSYEVCDCRYHLLVTALLVMTVSVHNFVFSCL